MYRLIVFDLDGTLVDSRRDIAESANALLEACGGDHLPEETIGRMVGDGAGTLIARAFAAAGLERPADALDRFLAIYDTRLLTHTRPYPQIAGSARGARRARVARRAHEQASRGDASDSLCTWSRPAFRRRARLSGATARFRGSPIPPDCVISCPGGRATRRRAARRRLDRRLEGGAKRIDVDLPGPLRFRVRGLSAGRTGAPAICDRRADRPLGL